MKSIRSQIVKLCADRLREFGYPDCNERNVLTDYIYSAFAVKILEETIGDAGAGSVIGSACKEVLDEIKAVGGEK